MPTLRGRAITTCREAIWATAHTTQFAQPGWQYLDSASGYLPEKGSYVSLRSADRKNWSVILETIGAKQPQTVSFHLAGGLAASAVHVWETNDTRTFEQVATIKPANRGFHYTFDPDSLYSLTTTTGQGKGTRSRRLRRRFPSSVCRRFRTDSHRTHPEVSFRSGRRV